ncbi:hypothetical protein AJ79_01933 [Helicocarpus griseus UAMH5409]|uniref:Partial AB-hydrolase lipase domain-containing protein n=1 Tax=Helicocarpus griseus UAMH5409 TaxID=1447875 RepID=A0A2B7Y3U9_9EURO|nr:hypothetical protein AJ79_01933 [Helicocarpus griseus UAMH5409]
MKSADVSASASPAYHAGEDMISTGPSVSAPLLTTGSPSDPEKNITTVPPDSGNSAYPDHPLFPPLPEYGPPSVLTRIQWRALRVVSFCLSLTFLGSIVLVASVSNGVIAIKGLYIRLRGGDPGPARPFWTEECKKKGVRQRAARAWEEEKRRQAAAVTTPRSDLDAEEQNFGLGEPMFEPLEGGEDLILCDISYYARRVGLDAETFKVQTEDGAVLTMWHLYNPKEYSPLPASDRDCIGPPSALQSRRAAPHARPDAKDRKYPILMIPGLLQNPGAFCTTDDDSLAFMLAKSGYDIWLGSNRGGFYPEHLSLDPSHPAYWSWTIKDMATLDLPALVTRVLYQTAFPKLALIGHSQGTAQSFLALSKHMHPSLGNHISIFCALSPAVYAGLLLNRPYLKFLRRLPTPAFRLFFGIHAFIPFMLTMHRLLPAPFYGAMGYTVFSHLFKWSDARWDRALRPRFFQYSPVYVSAECMRWWLGRGGFATHGCILSTREQMAQEEEAEHLQEGMDVAHTEKDLESNSQPAAVHPSSTSPRKSIAATASAAWYDERVPPMALWIAGSDELVDGRRLLRRLESGREPHVRVVHSKVIEEYEHLDVLWAMDAVEKVGRDVGRVVWECVRGDVGGVCRTPNI